MTPVVMWKRCGWVLSIDSDSGKYSLLCRNSTGEVIAKGIIKFKTLGGFLELIMFS